MPRITAVDTHDVRFPTSAEQAGSDAMHPDGDYSAAYLTLRTDHRDGHEGHGFTFTIGRGNDICVAAIEAMGATLVGLDIDEAFADMGAFARRLTGDSQFRWLGPEKGVVHLAAGALINAMWDLFARVEGKPVWKLLADMTPEQVVALVDWRYLSDALTPEEALGLLRAKADGKAAREAELLDTGYPAYTTSPGWLGYDDEKMVRLAREAVAEGFTMIKLKVGGNVEDDVRRFRTARAALGPDIRLASDANQKWDVAEAIAWMERLKEFDPYWIEEPTAPDDILGHAAIRRGVAPIKVATGEHAHNRILFKQLLQAEALDVVQIDAARVAGVNENVAILLLAAKFGVPVCPHAGGVGLCELVQHLSMFDFIAVSGSREGRAIESVPHLHEHFEDPIVVESAAYRAPAKPGFSAKMKPASLADHAFPEGKVWA
ncbi:L-fuconate dehydratase [Phytomonospora endophytica]|uniref:L-fuconate dehydratase n=1 Tax=Phytomonospora endophytica TaxID=714109 RepID=A0A841FNR8_9ACTN|nr:L-fuconate dehydratase [Phytomonospora endophytica]MBB6034867.1 L-fuconate dehydratase [Phytomonospora endophytica]GIG70571.1 mandelate racemase [Phytomonospora endophytica]